MEKLTYSLLDKIVEFGNHHFSGSVAVEATVPFTVLIP